MLICQQKIGRTFNKNFSKEVRIAHNFKEQLACFLQKSEKTRKKEQTLSLWQLRDAVSFNYLTDKQNVYALTQQLPLKTVTYRNIFCLWPVQGQGNLIRVCWVFSSFPCSRSGQPSLLIGCAPPVCAVLSSTGKLDYRRTLFILAIPIGIALLKFSSGSCCETLLHD